MLNNILFKKYKFNKSLLFITFYIILFLFLLKISNNIDYWQNDEWAYYPTVKAFMNGNYTLPSLMAPSFYTVGVIGAIYSSVFGLSSLPNLTLFVSILTVLIISFILYKIIKRSSFESFLLPMIILVSPLFVFTSFGFMTDNYFLMFLVASIYFISKYEKDKNIWSINFLLGNIFIIISYLARQLGLVTSLAFLIWLLVSRKYKPALVQLVLFAVLVSFHFFIFPKTGEMLETKFVFSNLTYFRHLFTTTYSIVIYLVFFILPLFVLFIVSISKPFFKNKKAVFVLFLFLTGIFVLVFDKYFNPLGWIGERFYYLKYTVHRRGFFVENIHGDKQGFPFFSQLYYVGDMITKLLISFGALVILASHKFKRYINFYSIYIIIYIGLLNVSLKLYDRYLLPVLIVAFLFIVSQKFVLNKVSLILVSVFIILEGYYSYNYLMDYFLSNKYIWNKANELVANNIEPKSIVATDAWKYLYSKDKNYLYKFTYDSPAKIKITDVLVDSYKIEYPFSFWYDNRIYLYKSNLNNNTD